ncbi:hypothetical protein wCauA_05945 [Wolbachia endosymbiont of Carposina sasakii]|uniref:hypothetical protein n=1 Tax=Wolbachia endosymbiont of Carposina sasakii TaxID=2591635 RepID=UPI00114504A8|nr:hypothetical protein [Wolbachia endosymbiont of Carposina sasakii]QDH19086.1 hypothetical protein wCauA_05945 [Wolbachia endosymbiont of Carposina sasakii]
MHNSNQNLSPGATSPTDITSDQEGTINKNSIESGTEQSLQGSLVVNQESLNDYVDASSTPVSEGINDTMQVADDNEVTSGNKGNRSVVSSDSTTLSEGSVNGQEGVTKSKKGKGKRSTSKRIQRSKQQLKEKDEEITALKAQQNTQEVADLQQQLQAKDEEITALKAQQNTQEVADLQQQLADKEKEIAQLKQQQPNAEVDKLKADLTAKEKEVDKLKKENKELEAENKKIQQLKQGNGARYTATVGMGLAAGLIAFTALERTVKLEMLVMIGIAVASALVAGGITYAVLPSTQVDGAKAQEVNENGKKK